MAGTINVYNGSTVGTIASFAAHGRSEYGFVVDATMTYAPGQQAAIVVLIPAGSRIDFSAEL